MFFAPFRNEKKFLKKVNLEKDEFESELIEKSDNSIVDNIKKEVETIVPIFHEEKAKFSTSDFLRKLNMFLCIFIVLLLLLVFSFLVFLIILKFFVSDSTNVKEYVSVLNFNSYDDCDSFSQDKLKLVIPDSKYYELNKCYTESTTSMKFTKISYTKDTYIINVEYYNDSCKGDVSGDEIRFGYCSLLDNVYSIVHYGVDVDSNILSVLYQVDLVSFVNVVIVLVVFVVIVLCVLFIVYVLVNLVVYYWYLIMKKYGKTCERLEMFRFKFLPLIIDNKVQELDVQNVSNTKIEVYGSVVVFIGFIWRQFNMVILSFIISGQISQFDITNPRWKLQIMLSNFFSFCYYVYVVIFIVFIVFFICQFVIYYNSKMKLYARRKKDDQQEKKNVNKMNVFNVITLLLKIKETILYRVSMIVFLLITLLFLSSINIIQIVENNLGENLNSFDDYSFVSSPYFYFDLLKLISIYFIIKEINVVLTYNGPGSLKYESCLFSNTPLFKILDKKSGIIDYFKITKDLFFLNEDEVFYEIFTMLSLLNKKSDITKTLSEFSVDESYNHLDWEILKLQKEEVIKFFIYMFFEFENEYNVLMNIDAIPFVHTNGVEIIKCFFNYKLVEEMEKNLLDTCEKIEKYNKQ